jgi:hypothetical protein
MQWTVGATSPYVQSPQLCALGSIFQEARLDCTYVTATVAYTFQDDGAGSGTVPTHADRPFTSHCKVASKIVPISSLPRDIGSSPIQYHKHSQTGHLYRTDENYGTPNYIDSMYGRDGVQYKDLSPDSPPFISTHKVLGVEHNGTPPVFQFSTAPSAHLVEHGNVTTSIIDATSGWDANTQVLLMAYDVPSTSLSRTTPDIRLDVILRYDYHLTFSDPHQFYNYLYFN